MSSVNLVTLTGPQPTSIIVSFGLTTSQSAGSIVQGQISAFGPLVPASPSIFIPITEVWQVTDIYVVGGPVAADGQPLFVVNGYPQVVTPTLSQLNLNLLTRFRLTQSIPLAPASSLAVSLSLLATPSTNATQILYMKIMRAPFTG
ncbi:MAG: hypothetical protein QW688_07305 [Thermoprotei archaeon]